MGIGVGTGSVGVGTAVVGTDHIEVDTAVWVAVDRVVAGTGVAAGDNTVADCTGHMVGIELVVVSSFFWRATLLSK